MSVDPNYYLSSLAGNNAVPSLDVNHDNYVSDEEYNAGTIRGKSNHPLDDASNWLPVSGHNVHVRITQITNLDTGATINDPLAIKQYLYYVDGNSNPVDENNQPYADSNTTAMPAFVAATTGTDGSVTIHMRAGPLIDSLGDVTMDIVDETQLDNAGTGTY